MFVKINTSGPRKYVKLVEAFRDDSGVARQRVVATLGRLEEIQKGKGDALLNGLLRASGKPTLDEGTGAVAFAPAVSVGDTWLLHGLWHELGFADAFRRVLRRHRRQFDAEHLLRVMVFNRLCDPESKLGILRWLEGARVPQVDRAGVTHQHLLRTMDTLNECTTALESALSNQLRPLIDRELSVVFYDLTTIRTEGSSESSEEIRRYGPSKDGGIARQVMLGVVQTAEGLPIHHEVFEGNAAETRTLVPTIEVFCYDVDERALNRAQMLDGKLILVTNMADHTPEQIVERYQALADIERGFRVLKSEIEIAPVFHRRADRIRAHALICFLALVLYRVLRMRLRDRHSRYSPERVLEIMRRIQFHQVTLHQNQTASGLSALTPEQRDLFDTIDLPKPSTTRL